MKNKKLLIITSIITLLPIVAGLVLWNQLPETIATHFNGNNEPDGWSSKAFTVFAIPAIMCALHLFCIVVTMNDPKRRNISDKLITLVYWIIPVISIVVMAMTYANALGIGINIGTIVNLIMGVLFIVLGNYLPKARQNFTCGVRTPWALSSEENWNRSNRLGGWLFVAVGFLFLINAFVLWTWAILIAAIIAAIIPAVYSFYLYKKGI